jgi:hypothetical protein
MKTHNTVLVDSTRLSRITANARRIRVELTPLLQRRPGQVCFRPGEDSIAMVGLLPHSPQMGLSHITDLDKLKAEFDRLFEKHCVNVRPDRPTPEKALQSWLISRAMTHAARMLPFDGLDLMFVVDEIPVYLEGGKKVVCDLLAVRKLTDGFAPVQIELKSNRSMKRLIAQIDDYSPVIDTHRKEYGALFGELLGCRIELTAPCEKWIVWSAAADIGDPRVDHFAARGIGVITYREIDGEYRFWCGPSPTR